MMNLLRCWMMSLTSSGATTIPLSLSLSLLLSVVHVKRRAVVMIAVKSVHEVTSEPNAVCPNTPIGVRFRGINLYIEAEEVVTCTYLLFVTLQYRKSIISAVSLRLKRFSQVIPASPGKTSLLILTVLVTPAACPCDMQLPPPPPGCTLPPSPSSIPWTASWQPCLSPIYSLPTDFFTSCPFSYPTSPLRLHL